MTKEKNYKKTLIACYLGFITRAIAASFAPLLFLTFQGSFDDPARAEGDARILLWAEDRAAALAAADLVTVSNEESAIARVIADIESGKIAF